MTQEAVAAQIARIDERTQNIAQRQQAQYDRNDKQFTDLGITIEEVRGESFKTRSEMSNIHIRMTQLEAREKERNGAIKNLLEWRTESIRDTRDLAGRVSTATEELTGRVSESEGNIDALQQINHDSKLTAGTRSTLIGFQVRIFLTMVAASSSVLALYAAVLKLAN